MRDTRSLADKTRELLEAITANRNASENRMKNARIKAHQEIADEASMQAGMRVTEGEMNVLPTLGSPGVSMGSRRASHPADKEKVPIK